MKTTANCIPEKLKPIRAKSVLDVNGDEQLKNKKREAVFRNYKDDYNIPLERIFEKKDNPATGIVSLQNLKVIRSRNLKVENEDFSGWSPVNENYRLRISRLIELAASKQIRIYFYIPPRLGSDDELQTIGPVYKKLAPANKPAVAQDEESLYRLDTSYDDYHLSNKGALKFTESTAAAFNDRIF